MMTKFLVKVSAYELCMCNLDGQIVGWCWDFRNGTLIHSMKANFTTQMSNTMDQKLALEFSLSSFQLE